MKKYLLSIAVLLAGAVMLTSCDDDDDDENVEVVPGDDNNDDGTSQAQGNGVYVINSGNQGKQIDGSLTYVSADWSSTKDIFKSVNGISLGLTANDGLVYGSKLYVAVTGENTVWVIDNSTLNYVKRLSTTELMGDDKGKQPRHLAAGDGRVYVSTFDGYVAAIDTVDYDLKATYQAGSKPEGMAVYAGHLYVANSDYGYGNASISDINLTDGTVTELRDELINNPVALTANEYGLFVLDSGTYDENWMPVNAGVRRIVNGEVTLVAEATAMGVGGTKIYTAYAPYGAADAPRYGVYDMATGQSSVFIADGDIETNPDAPFSPSAIGVDTVSGYVYIASYQKDPDTGSASYAIDGYLNVYDMSGQLVKSVPTGVGPTAVVPNVSAADE